MLLSCSNDKDSPQNNDNIDSYLFIYLQDSKGNNLLDTENYLETEMKLFYVVNGVSKEFYNASYDTPKNLKIIKESSPFKLIVYPNNTDKEEFPVTYLQLNKTDTDTIKCHFRRTEGSEICDKVWYNGKIVSDYTNPKDAIKGRVIDIIK